MSKMTSDKSVMLLTIRAAGEKSKETQRVDRERTNKGPNDIRRMGYSE